MPNEVKVRTTAPGAKQATGEVKGLRDAFDRLQKQGAKGFGVGVGAAVTAKSFGILDTALASSIDFMADSIKASSNLNEQMSKSEVVFGSAADEIQDFGEQASESLGLSKRAALEAASNFGSFFTGAGESADAAADMSKNLVTLAADLASFNNLDPTDVLQKLQSGLSGEAEPMRRLGVFLTEAKVKAKAMELGLADAHGELSEGAKIIARYNIILEETQSAQGDFARTSDSLANQQRSAAAKLEDAQAKIGRAAERLGAQALPLFADGIDLVADAADRMNTAIEGAADDSADALLDLGGVLMDVFGPTRGVGRALDEFQDQWLTTAERIKIGSQLAETATDDWKDTGVAVDDLTGALADNEDQAKDTEDAAADIADAWKDAAKAADDLADGIDFLSGKLFDSDIIAGELAEAQQELADLLKEGAESTRPGDWTIYKGKLADAEKKVFDLNYQQKLLAGDDDLLAWLIAQKDQFDKNNVAVQTTIDKLIALQTRIVNLNKVTSGGITFTGIPTVPTGGGSGGGGTTAPPTPPAPIGGGGGQTFTPLATGGPVSAGRAYLVGEQGPELMVPKTAGTIIPNDELGTTGNTIINLTVQGSLVARNSQDVVAALQRAASFLR